MFSLYVWGEFVNRCWTGRNSVAPQIRVTRFPTLHITSSSHSLEVRKATLGVGINSSSRTGGVRNSICISVDGGNYMYSPSTTPFLKPARMDGTSYQEALWMERKAGVKETSRAPRRYRTTSGGLSGGRRVRISVGYLLHLKVVEGKRRRKRKVYCDGFIGLFKDPFFKRIYYTGCFTTCGHYCRRWFPRSLWSKKFI